MTKSNKTILIGAIRGGTKEWAVRTFGDTFGMEGFSGGSEIWRGFQVGVRCGGVSGGSEMWRFLILGELLLLLFVFLIWRLLYLKILRKWLGF